MQDTQCFSPFYCSLPLSPRPQYGKSQVGQAEREREREMSFLRGSANYVWCTTSVLGKGATGAVFQGVNKHNGETVAVKTFNQLSHMRPQEVQMREFEVLQKVKHENIVKLLAIEEEQVRDYYNLESFFFCTYFGSRVLEQRRI